MSAGTQPRRLFLPAASPTLRYGLFVLWLVAAVVGAIGLGQRIFVGDRLAAYSSYVPWGLWVAAYIFFVGLSAGAFLISSLGYAFGLRQFEPIGPVALLTAAVTLIMGLLMVLADLGHPERFLEVFLRPQLRSMMAWVVWMYTAYFVLLAGMLTFALRRRIVRLQPAQVQRDDRRLRILSTIGVPLAIAFPGASGALFGTVIAREYWNTAIFPILFLVGGVLSGGALLTAVVVFLWPKRDEAWRDLVTALTRIVLGLLVVQLVLEFAEITIPAWYQIGSEASLVNSVLFGPYWYVFWLVHGLLGVVIPLVLLTRPSPLARGVGAGLVAVSFLAVRLNLVIPGLVSPELQGLERAYLDPIGGRLTYAYLPSLFEWQVVIGVVAFGIALFYLGRRFLPILGPDSFSQREDVAR